MTLSEPQLETLILPSDRENTTASLVRNKELQEAYTSNWIWRATSALVETMGENFSITRAAQLLGVSVENIVLAIEGLEGLGIIEKTDKGYKKILKFVYFTDRELDPDNLVQDHVLISSQLLTRLNSKKPSPANFYRTGFLSVSVSKAKAFYSKLDRLLKDLITAPSEENETVIALSFTSVNLINEELQKK